MAHIDSYIWILRHQRVKLFDRMRRKRKYGLTGESVSLGVDLEVLKAHARLRFFFVSGSGCEVLSHCSNACLHASVPPTVMTMD